MAINWGQIGMVWYSRV